MNTDRSSNEDSNINGLRSLARVPAPSDFEMQTRLRVSLSSLPSAPVPDAFETNVLRKLDLQHSVFQKIIKFARSTNRGRAISIALGSLVVATALYFALRQDTNTMLTVPAQDAAQTKTQAVEPQRGFDEQQNTPLQIEKRTEPTSHTPKAEQIQSRDTSRSHDNAVRGVTVPQQKLDED